jgi:hypothetical protein
MDGAVEGGFWPQISALIGSWKDDLFDRRPDSETREMELLGVVIPRRLFVDGGSRAVTLAGATKGHFNRPGVPGVVKSCSISTSGSAERPLHIRTPRLAASLEFWRYRSFSRASSALWILYALLLRVASVLLLIDSSQSTSRSCWQAPASSSSSRKVRNSCEALSGEKRLSASRYYLMISHHASGCGHKG